MFVFFSLKNSVWIAIWLYCKVLFKAQLIDWKDSTDRKVETSILHLVTRVFFGVFVSFRNRQAPVFKYQVVARWDDTSQKGGARGEAGWRVPRKINTPVFRAREAKHGSRLCLSLVISLEYEKRKNALSRPNTSQKDCRPPYGYE